MDNNQKRENDPLYKDLENINSELKNINFKLDKINVDLLKKLEKTNEELNKLNQIFEYLKRNNILQTKKELLVEDQIINNKPSNVLTFVPFPSIHSYEFLFD